MDKHKFFEKLFGSKTGSVIIILVVILFLIVTFIGFTAIYAMDDVNSAFKAMGFGMIMVWSCIFICYFIWATCFYNLNYGITDKDWKKIEDAKKSRSDGLTYNQEDINEEPLYNPYRDETFGLPPGTVRGMIAFTLLFGAIAMLIVSFGFECKVCANNLLVDQFEFFKTAFLMMVAFYFGSSSLKYLKKDTNGKPRVNTREELYKQNQEVPGEKAVTVSESDQKAGIQVLPVDTSDPSGENTPKDDKTPIIPVDPMQKK
jgi:magnesium-transporting ATPase (P-type)